MKKLFIFACVIGLVLSGASPLFAGGADNKTNWSAEYIRSLNRNAATDSADIVMYNPAGVMKMEDGLYGNASAHNVLKYYNNEINGVNFDQDKPSVVPGLFAVYKRDRWSGFFGVSNVVGGGKVEFDYGNATTNTLGLGLITGANALLSSQVFAPLLTPGNYYSSISSQQLKAEQTGPGYTLGGAFAINDMFSAALAARYVDTEREAKGHVTFSAATPFAIPGVGVVNPDQTAFVDYEEDADGWGFLVGVNIAPMEQLNIGIRYESQVDLDFDQTIKEDNFGVLSALGVTDGGERTRNLPAILGLGVSYQVTPKMRLETNLTYYFNEEADFDDIPGTSRDESAVDNGYDLGIAIEYAISDTVKGSFGYLYTDTGVDAEDMTPELPELDAHSFGTGIAWAVTPLFDVNVGIGKVFYQSDSFVSSTTGAAVKYEKDITFLAFGLQYKFM
jgi:long-chain fatty acid transport protein